MRFFHGCIITLLFLGFVGFAGEATAQNQGCPRIELGPELNNIYLPINPVGSVNYQPGLGGVFAFNVVPWFALDSSFTITPTASSAGSSFAGGRLTQFNAGVRAGIKKGRLGFYGKVRPGLASFGSVIKTVDFQTFPPQFGFGRLTEPSLDVGGIVQVYISRRFALRFEAGDTIIRYGSRTLFVGQPPVSGVTTNNFEYGVGFIFRFH
jgi:hypothetical protein